MQPTFTFEEPQPPSRPKRFVQFLLSAIQLIIAILLLVVVILLLVGRNPAPFILYLLPLVILTTVLEICHIFRRPVPSRISEKLGAFSELRVRAFAYQAGAAYGLLLGGRCYGWNCYMFPELYLPASIISWTVWGLGVALFILAIVAKECGFESWVEAPKEDTKIQLVESDEEDGGLVGAGGIARA